MEWIQRAGEAGADLVAFGEAWLPGFPIHMFQEPYEAKVWEAASMYLSNAVSIPGPETDMLCETARKSNCDVAMGVVEIDPRTRGTVYCTLLFIGRGGRILGRHRKLKPTFTERSIWGEGDASGLVAYERPYGRLSGLNCWEHQMVLPTYALAQAGTNVHVAAWPGHNYEVEPGEIQPHYSRQLLLSRAFASQTASYVIASAGLRTRDDLPAEFREFAPVDYAGHSVIIDPRGEVVAGR